MIVKFFENISLHQMKNFLYFDLMQKFANCLTQDQALGDKFQVQQAAFLAAFERLDAALMASRKSLLTPEIQRLDTKRVQEWKLIYSAVRESMKMPDEAIANAADFVLSLLNNHGDVPNMKVTERTGALTNLCQDLTVKYAAQVEPLGLGTFATQLAATNVQYLQKYEERLHEWSEYVTVEVKNSRKVMDDVIENLFIMVASGIISEGMAPYKHFVDYANEAIKVARVAMGSPTTKPDGTAPEVPGNGETTPPAEGDQQPDNTPDTNPDDSNQGDNNQGGGGTGGLTPDPDAPTNPDNGGNTNPGGGYVPPSNGGGFD